MNFILIVLKEYKMFPKFFGRVVEICEYERGLLYEKGSFCKVVTSGRYKIWPWQHHKIVIIDIRETSHTIQGQEILSKDKIGIRVTLIAQYKVDDPILAVHSVENYQNQLYQDLQLTLRESITGRTVDEILEDRDALSNLICKDVALRAQKYGILLNRVGVKDIILPGVVRSIFLQEIEAERKGRAEQIAARYQVAIARSKANTAKLLNENPNMMRLEELKTLSELASKEGNVIIIPGLENIFTKQKQSLNGTAHVNKVVEKTD